MDSLNRNYLKYALVFLLGLSVALNLVFYLRLSGPCGKSGDKCEKTENVQAISKEKTTEATSTSQPMASPAALSTPSVPVADEAKASSSNAKQETPSLRYVSHSLDYSDCDGKKAKGTLRITIYGLRNQKEAVAVKVEPKPDKLDDVEFGYSLLSMKGVFEFGKTYTVRIPKGITVYDDKILKDDYLCMVDIVQPDPRIDFATEGPYYQTKAENGIITEWTMPVEHINEDSVQVILWGLEDRNIDVSENLIRKYWDSDDNAVTRLMQRLADVDVKLNGQKNVSMTTCLDLAKHFPNLHPGVYAVALNTLDSMRDENAFYEHYTKRLVVLSDLGISAVGECHKGTIAVCVRHLSDGSAVADADISLISTKRKILATGKSGADGTVLLSFDNGIYDIGDRAETIIARTKDDISYIRLNVASELSKSEFPDGDWNFNTAYYPFVYTERGVYKPGETVHVSAFVRIREDDKLKPASVPVNVRVMDSRYDHIYKKTIMPNANGFLTFELPLSSYAPTGVYNVSCTVGKEDSGCHSFQVASFVPDRIKVIAKPEKDLIASNEDFFLSFASEYYFGGRVEDVKYAINMYATVEFPKHWKEYSVGNAKRKNAPIGGDFAVTPKDAKAGRILLPSPDVYLEKIDKGLLTVPLRVSVQVSATEESAMTVTKTATLNAMPHPYLLGLKYNGCMDKGLGSDAAIEFRFLGFEAGAPVAFEETEFTLKLQKSEWEYVLVKNTILDKTRMEWTQILKDVKAPTSYKLDKESAIFTLPELQNGNYILTATSKSGLETKLEFWHWSGAAGSVHSTNPNIITATSDKEKYAPGESATIKFFANSDGACFVAAGEEKVDSTMAFDVKRGENSVTIPIAKGALTSMYYVSITVVGKVEDNISRGFGLLGLKLDQTANRLGLKLEAPEKAEPKQKITVNLKADEAATAQIFAVDEGILALTNYKTPDIFDFFHGDYSSTFNTYDIYSLIYPKLAIDRVDKVGGGDVGEEQRRPKLKEKESAVVVLGAVEIPQSGTATAELELPDHTGAMRIMAVAAGATKVDSTDSTIIMRDKISVLPSLPLAVASGDKFQGTFKLFNHDIDATDAKLSVTLPPEIKADGVTSFNEKLEKGKSATCRVLLTANGNGAFPIEYRLELGGKTVTGKVHVNVRSIMPYMTDAKQALLKPGEALELPAVTDEWQSIADRQINVSSNPASAVKDALGWLNDYPYGCLEQTTSKAFPMLFVDSLISAGLIDAGFKPQSQQKVNAAVTALLAMRRGSRGFVGWIDSDVIWDGPGVYAAHFLFLAKNSLMTDNDIICINAFLENKIEDESDTEKAYAFYVRSLKPMTVKTLQKLSDRVLKDSKSNAMSRFLTGAAFYNAGHATKGSELVKNALDEKAWLHSANVLPWMLSSKTVRTSLILSIAMDILPDHPATMTMAMELASHLRKDNKCWGTTRDNAFASVALGKFAAYHKHGDIAMQITEGNEQPIESTSDNFHKKLAKDSKVTVRNTGKSDLFIRLTTSGIPVKVNHDKDIVSIKKVILDKDGKPVSKVMHGDLLTVQISIKTVALLEDAVLLDLIPGGFSIEDGSLATRAKLAEQVEDEFKNRPYITRKEILADRFILFGTIPNHRESVITYRIRAVTPGTYAVPPTRVEDMYEPDKCGTGDANQSIVIEQP